MQSKLERTPGQYIRLPAILDWVKHHVMSEFSYHFSKTFAFEAEWKDKQSMTVFTVLVIVYEWTKTLSASKACDFRLIKCYLFLIVLGFVFGMSPGDEPHLTVGMHVQEPIQPWPKRFQKCLNARRLRLWEWFCSSIGSLTGVTTRAGTCGVKKQERRSRTLWIRDGKSLGCLNND